jgi:hypothetical protein
LLNLARKALRRGAESFTLQPCDLNLELLDLQR